MGDVERERLTPEVKAGLDVAKKAKRRALGELARNHRPEYQRLLARHLELLRVADEAE